MKYYSITLLILAIIFSETIALGKTEPVFYGNNHIEDTPAITYSNSVLLDLGPDLEFCQGDSAVLDATTAGSTYEWQDGSTNPTYTVTTSGTYWVNVTTGSVIESDTVNVIVNNTSNFSFGPDFTACTGDIVILSGFTPDASYLWNDGTTSSFLYITQPGTYWLEVDLNGCLHSDTVEVSFVPSISVDLGPNQNICLGDQVNLNAFINDPTVTYAWQDGTTTSTYTVTQTGTYHVTLDNGVCPTSDTIEIFVNSTSAIDLGPDTNFCTGESIVLDSNLPGATFSWQDGSTGATFTVNQTGWYWVTATIGTCSDTDSIYITETPTPTINLGLDQSLCDGDSIELDAFYPGATYLWNDGSTNSTNWVSQSGSYSVIVDLNNCTFTDNVQITSSNTPNFNLGNDTSLCEGESFLLSGFTPGATYLWQDGSTNSNFTVTQSGTYILEVNINGCSSLDTLIASFTSSPIIDLGPDVFVCTGDSIFLDASFPGAIYNWSTGSTSNGIYASQNDQYIVDLDLNGCTYSDTITITLTDSPNFSLGNDTNLCQGESLILSGLTPGANYLWQDGSTNSDFTVTQTGTYYLTVDLNGCDATDSIQVNFTLSPIINLGPDQAICDGDSLLLDASFIGASYQWSTGSTNSSISVDQTGTYTVDLDLNGCTFTDSISITVNNVSSFNLGNDTTLCQGETLVLSGFTAGATTYLWQDGSTNSFYNVTQSGQYHLTVDLNGCFTEDTIDVQFDPSPIINLGPDQAICDGDSLLLDASFPGANYLWSTGSTNSSIFVDQTGTYTVDLDLNGCTFTDSISITVNNVSSFNLGNDTTLCQGETLVLSGFTAGATYLWQDGSTNSFYNVTQSGQYHLTVDLNGCFTEDTINVQFDPSPIINLGPDQAICDGDSLLLDASFTGASYQWSTGSTNSSIYVDQTGTYTVDLDLNGCTFTDSISVTVNNVSSFDLGNDTTLCQGETLVLSGFTAGATYLWQNGSTNSFFNVTQSGQYHLTVDLNGCFTEDTINVQFDPSPIINLGPDQFICEGDSILLNAFYLGANYLWQNNNTTSSIWASQPGLYYVQLDLNGCSFIDSIQITVGNVANINLGNDTSICQGETLILSSNVSGAIYTWQDGSSNNSFTVSQTGTYSLQVDLNGCLSNDTIEVTVQPSPIISLGPDLSICEGDSVQLNAFYPGASYTWQDGSNNATLWANQTGSYSVTLNLNGCTFTDQINITVTPYPIIDLGNDTSICASETLLLNAGNPGAIYQWQDGSNNSTFSVNQSGTYHVAVDQNGCISYDTIIVTVKPLPIINLGPDISVCEGDEIELNAFFPGATYQWNTGSTNSTLLVTEEGQYIIDLYLNGCTYQESIYITYHPIPVINLQDSVEICDGDFYSIDASYPNNSSNYLWHDGSTSPLFNATNAGWQIVTVEANGCYFTDSLYLTVYDLPETSLEDASICLGEEFIFNAFSPDAILYEWQDGSESPTFTASEQGWYYVDIYNENCDIRDSAFLTVNTVPLSGLPSDTFLCEDEPIIFNFDAENASYLWQDGSTSNNYTINELGIYSLIISNSCGTSEFTMKVHPKDCTCNTYIPNAFSPGNGGINEDFTVSADCEFTSFLLKIYNRWGKQVFESNTPSNKWNGEIDGEILPQDVYIYKLVHSFEDKNELHTLSGVITLLR